MGSRSGDRFAGAALLLAVVLVLATPAPARAHGLATPRAGDVPTRVTIGSDHFAGNCTPPNMDDCDNTPLPAGTVVTYTASVGRQDWQVPDPPITGTARFYRDGVLKATVPLSNGSATWKYAPPPGGSGIHAEYSGDDTYAPGTSTTLFQWVAEPAPPTTQAPPPTHPPAAGGATPTPTTDRVAGSPSSPTGGAVPGTSSTTTTMETTTTAVTKGASGADEEAGGALGAAEGATPGSSDAGAGGVGVAAASGAVGAAVLGTALVLRARRRGRDEAAIELEP